MNKRLLLSTITFIWFSICAFADIQMQNEHFTTQHGLPNNSIRYMLQDSKGFMWFGTLNGLSRYDGNSFVNFFPGEDGDVTLADARINRISEDSNKHLWITTFGNKISCYDLSRGRFVDFTGCGEYEQPYGYITHDDNGDVWLWGHGQGVRRVTYNNKDFASKVYSTVAGNLASDEINFLISEKGGDDVWIGTDNGLYLFDGVNLTEITSQGNYLRGEIFGDAVAFVKAGGDVERYDRQSKTIRRLGQLDIIRSRTDVPGASKVGDNIWLILTSTGAYEITPAEGKISPARSGWNVPGGIIDYDNKGNLWIHNHTGHLRYISADGKSNSDFELMSLQDALRYNNERFYIVEDDHGLIWISTLGNGVYLYNPETGIVDHLLFDNNGYSVIPGNAIQYVTTDNAGGVWISAEFSGVSHIKAIDSNTARIFPEKVGTIGQNVNDVRLMVKKGQNEILVGTRDGKVFSYDSGLTKSLGTKSYDKNPYDYLRDSKGREWMAMRGDGIIIDGIKYTHSKDDANSLSSNEMFCLLEDKSGRMWAGTFGGGLNLVTLDKENIPTFKHFFNDSYGQRRIQALTEDADGYIWAATSDGIYVFYPDSLISNPKAYHHYNKANSSLRSDEIKAITTDRRGDVWIAENGVGFAVCTPKAHENLEFRHYDTKDGLVDPMVMAFVDVSPKQMWITTEYGLSCFNPQDHTFNNYIFNNDIAGDTYSQGSAIILDNGLLALGTRYGVNLVDPDILSTQSAVKTPTFTNLTVNGVDIKETDLHQDYAISYTESIRLPYDHNSIRVDFSNLDFPINGKQLFSYRLDGYDKDWSAPSTQSFAVYKNLPPGSYKLHIKAVDINGRSDDNISTIEIKIMPPWWRTIWAYLLYALVLIAIGCIIYRNVKHTISLRNKIKIEKELTDFKLTFFTNISHEFRTPLTLISGALQRMRRADNVPAEVKSSMQVMDKSTQRMMRLINQILEFRKMQKGKLALSLVETDVVVFVREIYESFIDSAVAKKIDYQMKSSIETYNAFIDKGNLDKVMYNLLSNAFKYTPSGGSVTLTLDILPASQQIMIKVIDTGMGIPEEKRSQIFERFAHGSYATDSMGIGLNLSYELVKVHKGTISYGENPSGGTIFTVVIPTDKSIYDKNDFVTAVNEPTSTESPVKPTDFVANDTEDPDEAKTPLNNRQILVIEDDNDVREFLRVELSSYFEVLTASDGTEGLAIAKDNNIDLVVCDVMMPGISGFEVTANLKNNFATSHLPVILLTALSANDKHIEGIKSGADAYITKPFSTDILISRIFQLIEQRDKLKEKYSTDLSMKAPIMASTDADKEFIDRLTAIVEKHIDNAEFTVDDFAQEMAMGRTIFFRKVKGITGYAPKEYLRITRMKKAAELLITTNDTVAEVAFKVGIDDPLYFSKCFKAQFNISPTNYRKEQKAQEGTDS